MRRMGDVAPFQAIGMIYLGVREFCARRVPGGDDAISQRLPADVQRFWRQLFLANGKYDALPLLAITRAAAELAGMEQPDLVRENARFIAHRDIHGVYRLLLKIASPRQVALRMAKVSMRYFFFGAAESEPIGESAVLARQTGVPTVFADFLTWAAEGFATVALETAGASGVSVQRQAQVPDGEVGGIETSTITWHMQWKPG
jgi:hypothetical protein